MTQLVTIAQPTALAPVTIPTDQNPALVYLASLGESSRRPMRQSLDVIAAIVAPDCDHTTFPWGALRYQHTQAIRARLAESYSAATANRHLTALRSALKECWRLGYMGAEEYQRAIDLKAVKGQKASQAERGRHLAHGELAALLTACDDDSATGARDVCLIGIAYLAGLRRAELANLTLDDYDLDQCLIGIVAGKGNKDRIIPIGEQGCEFLSAWLAVRGNIPGPLYVQIRRGDHVTDEGLTGQAVYYILNERAKQAGVKKFSPHDLRRTFAGNLLDAGVDISTVQKLMGHASSDTTAGYDRRDARAKRAAVNKLHIPWQRRG